MVGLPWRQLAKRAFKQKYIRSNGMTAPRLLWSDIDRDADPIIDLIIGPKSPLLVKSNFL